MQAALTILTHYRRMLTPTNPAVLMFGYTMQVFLALPSNCPTDPAGSSRSVDGQTRADSVLLYASADEAQTFEQVTI